MFERDERKHDCGHDIEVCSDPERVWYPQRVVCYKTMEQKSAEATYHDLHKDRPFHNGKFKGWSKEWSAATPCHFMDGVTIIVTETDLKPDDDFLGARPTASGSTT